MISKTRDGLDTYYELRGNTKSERTIVLLNGLTQSTFAWHFCIPFFEKDFRIILLDFIFQGKSSREGEWRNFDQHAEDVNEVLVQEKCDKAIILGISYGSIVAQHFALLFPAKTERLVLLSTFAHKTPYYEAIELAWWHALEKGGYNLMLDIMLPNVLSENYFANPVVPINLLKEGRRELNQSSDAIFKLMTATRNRPDYREKLKGIRAGTLIIQGEKDSLFPVAMAEEVQKNIQGSKLVVIKNAGHTLNLEHVSEVCKTVKDFLKQVE